MNSAIHPTVPPTQVWWNASWAITSAMALFSLVLVVSAPEVSAQGRGEDYERSESYTRRTRELVFRDSVNPNWIGDHDSRFWYQVQTGTDSHQFILVDAASGRREPAFHHEQLAEQLSKETGADVNPMRLELRSLTFLDDASRCRFRYADKRWQYELPGGPLAENDAPLAVTDDRVEPAERVMRSRNGGDRTPIRFENRLEKTLTFYWVMPDGNLRRYGNVAAGKSESLGTYAGHAWVLKDEEGDAVAAFVASPVHELAVIDSSTVKPEPLRKRGRGRREFGSISPDGQWRVTFEHDNAVVQSIHRDDDVLVTDDGKSDNRYGGRVWWSPDSACFVVMKTKPGLRRTIHLVDSAPDDSIHSELVTIPYAKPGDPVDHSRPVLFRHDGESESEWKPQLIDDALFPKPYQNTDLAWDATSESFSFLYNERGHQCLRLITVDSQTANPRITIDETSNTFVCYSSKSFLHRIDARDELIWMSERSGWNHLYLIDANTGDVKNAITTGDWVVRQVEQVDVENRHLYAKVSGIDPTEDPYHVHLIRVNFDGTDLVRLTHGDGDHQWQFSPGGKYLIDTYSRVDLPPITQLVDATSGELICELERADASALLEIGWRPPERFVAKGRDGETDIHGIIVRPTNFDPNQRYPVLEEIYAGPHASFVPKTFGLHSSLYSMAELGFIVVKIDGMGTSNRSKAFHDVCWKNLSDSGFPDRIAWMKAAATDRPEMDLNRVGIWGGSAGGQSAMRALIAHGEFYRAAVADCGCHDNRVDKIWWNEQWMGHPIGPHYDQQSNVTQAHRLQGDLMLIWGELDRNVDPASTMQVIDALVRADKDFEQLIVPGTGHGAAGHPYAKRRQADFFIRKLWNREPRAK